MITVTVKVSLQQSAGLSASAVLSQAAALVDTMYQAVQHRPDLGAVQIVSLSTEAETKR